MDTVRVSIELVRKHEDFSLQLEMYPCDVCGDDIGIHEWVDLDAEGTITGCDRI